MEILELKNITEMKLNKHAQRRMEGTEEQISEPEDREREFIQPKQQRRQAETRQYPEPSVQFSSVAQSCPTLCDPMDGSTPCFSVYHQLPELAQTHVHRVGDAILPSHPLSSPSPPALQSLSASGSFPMSQFFPSGGQSIAASASVLPMNIQG